MAGSWRIGVCSWSLEPPDADALAQRASATGATAVQLALDPIRLGVMRLDETRRRLKEAGLTIASGMMAMAGEDYSTIASIRETGGVAPDGTWAANRAAARELAKIAGELGLGLVTFHAGFLPDAPSDPRWEVMVARLRELAGLFGARDTQVALETGQESAAALLRMLDALAPERIGVNFDPGNLILYGSGDPIPALHLLAPRIAQVHIKDALPALDEESWGSEVPVGRGAMDWAALLGALRECPAVTTLVIEREAGTTRVDDVAEARRFLESVIG
jgi:sugar phosphate isomerase/epimerase